jgi:hypothetical protein
MNTKGVNFQPSKRGQFSAAVDKARGRWPNRYSISVAGMLIGLCPLLD